MSIDYARRHADAWANPKPGYEKAFVLLITGLQAYAEAHAKEWDSPIAEDYVLGPAHADIADGINTLLNGERGRLDAGTLNRMILPFIPENRQ